MRTLAALLSCGHFHGEAPGGAAGRDGMPMHVARPNAKLGRHPRRALQQPGALKPARLEAGRAGLRAQGQRAGAYHGAVQRHRHPVLARLEAGHAQRPGPGACLGAVNQLPRHPPRRAGGPC